MSDAVQIKMNNGLFLAELLVMWVFVLCPAGGHDDLACLSTFVDR